MGRLNFEHLAENVIGHRRDGKTILVSRPQDYMRRKTIFFVNNCSDFMSL